MKLKVWAAGSCPVNRDFAANRCPVNRCLVNRGPVNRGSVNRGSTVVVLFLKKHGTQEKTLAYIFSNFPPLTILVQDKAGVLSIFPGHK